VIIANTEPVVSSIGSVWTVAIAGKKGGNTLMMLEEYTCDLCESVFLPVNMKNIFCPSCGSSQVRKDMGSNELSDEDVYIGILSAKEKASFLF
jgi:hypothetical protein